jgi:hypothetical protein
VVIMSAARGSRYAVPQRVHGAQPRAHNDAGHPRRRPKPLRAIRRSPSGAVHRRRWRGVTGGGARRAALPVSADDASGSAVAYTARAALVLGVPESAPCPLIAAAFCERVGGSRTGREPGRRSRRLEGVLDAAVRGADHARRAGAGRRGGLVRVFTGGVLAFLSGRDQPRRPGTGGRAASLTWVRGAQVGRPGDKMIDWVSPPAGMRPLSLIRPPAWPFGARTQAGSG